MKHLAPVLLFVYNRPQHTLRTLEALAANELAGKSTLYVFADGPKQDANTEMLSRINEVRSIAKGKQWCKEVIVTENQYNVGLANSIISGVTSIVNKYGKVIVLEDDLVTSKGFLKYMNEALVLYEEDIKIAGINGYNFPFKKNLGCEIYFTQLADSWGWATWKRAWDLFERDAGKLLHEIKLKELHKSFDFANSYPFTNMLESQVKKEIDSWAIRWYASTFLQKKLFLIPSKSLVQNIGFDNFGTHCTQTEIYTHLELKDTISINFIPVKESKEGREFLIKFFNSLKKRNYLYNNKFFDFIKKFYKKFKRNKQTSEWSTFKGTWAEALLYSTGYDSKSILKRVYESNKKVKLKEAVYERDSVIFSEVQWNWPLLASLGMIAAKYHNKLNVVDFGGSLGTTYYSLKSYFKDSIQFKWTIVEQQSFVQIGNSEFATEELGFIDSLDRCKLKDVQVIILSGVIQYIENPELLLQEIFSLESCFILIDRTSFIKDSKKRLVIQKVPKEIYEADYPCWLFNEEEFLNLFTNKYKNCYSFESVFDPVSLTEDKIHVIYKGYLFEKL